MISLMLLVTTVVLVVLLIGANVKIVKQSEVCVIERLGSFHTIWETGLHFKIPFIDVVAQKVSLKEEVIDFAPQDVITKDNVSITIDTVVFCQITDAKLFTYGIHNPVVALENLTATTLRNKIGGIDLDETLTSRETINSALREVLDEATDQWGIKVNRVELRDITPPESIIHSMEKEMKAERERREITLKADGQSEAEIKLAEGHKRSAILNAEAEYESAKLRAEAEKNKCIIEAEGERQRIELLAEADKIRKQKMAEAQKYELVQLAEAEAETIRVTQEATSKGIELLNNSKPSKEVLTLKSFDALAKVADGKATKIIIPSEIQNLSGLISSVKELSTETISSLSEG